MGVLRRVGCGLIVGVGLLSGASAPGASAYSVSGGAYVGTATNDPTFTFAGAYTIACPSTVTTYWGSATGSATTSFTASYGAGTWCNFFGLPASVSVAGTQSITVNAGGSGVYTGSFHIPASTTITFNVPAAGCTVTVTGTQYFSHGFGGNVVSAFNLSGGIGVAYSIDGVAYTASGCPFFSGFDGSAEATFVAPGPTIS